MVDDLTDQGDVSAQGNDLGVDTDNLEDIYICICRCGATIDRAVPSGGCRVSREILSLEYQLSPAIENAHGLYIIQTFSPGVEDVVDAVIVGREGIRYKIILRGTDCFYQYGIDSDTVVIVCDLYRVGRIKGWGGYGVGAVRAIQVSGGRPCPGIYVRAVGEGQGKGYAYRCRDDFWSFYLRKGEDGIYKGGGIAASESDGSF